MLRLLEPPALQYNCFKGPYGEAELFSRPASLPGGHRSVNMSLERRLSDVCTSDCIPAPAHFNLPGRCFPLQVQLAWIAVTQLAYSQCSSNNFNKSKQVGCLWLWNMAASQDPMTERHSPCRNQSPRHLARRTLATCGANGRSCRRKQMAVAGF